MHRLALVLLLAAGFAPLGSSFRSNTWTVVAMDPNNGDVGVAGASCVPLTYMDALAVLVPGKGAAAVQALWDLDNRNRVYQWIKEGREAVEIARDITSRANDAAAEDRQYGIVTFKSGKIQIAAHTGSETMPWSGEVQDPALGVTVQGNILEGAAVVEQALKAYQQQDKRGANSLPDRLMRALEAGSAAGGDSRCNNHRVRQTAASAFLLVAGSDEPPYVAVDIGRTDQASRNRPRVALSVIEPQYGANAVTALRRKYDRWKAALRR